MSICLFMFLQRREKPLMQLPQKSRCQQFGAVPSVPVFCFSCLSSPSRLMLHFAFPRCIRRVKEWSEHIRGNPLFAWWTYLFTPGSSHLEVITAPLSQPLITGFVVQSRSFKSSQLERLYLTVLPSPSLDQWGIVLLNTSFRLAVRLLRVWSCSAVTHWRLAAAEMKLRLVSGTRVLIQRSLWRRAQWAGTSPGCAAETRTGTLLNWELGGIRLHCYCLFDEGLNLVNPDLHMGFLI